VSLRLTFFKYSWIYFYYSGVTISGLSSLRHMRYDSHFTTWFQYLTCLFHILRSLFPNTNIYKTCTTLSIQIHTHRNQMTNISIISHKKRKTNTRDIVGDHCTLNVADDPELWGRKFSANSSTCSTISSTLCATSSAFPRSSCALCCTAGLIFSAMVSIVVSLAWSLCFLVVLWVLSLLLDFFFDLCDMSTRMI